MLAGVAVIVVGGIFVPLLMVPIGLVLLGVAFVDLRYTSKEATLITPRALILTGVIAAATVTISTLLVTVPGLQTDWVHHGPNDAIILTFVFVQWLLVGWLAAATGYLGYAVWVRFRHGDATSVETED
jgi:hypothetical protein